MGTGRATSAPATGSLGQEAEDGQSHSSDLLAAQRQPTKTSSVGRRASGAIVSTFVNAGGSLLLQVLAARTLGVAGYGAFALFVGILVLVTAVQTSWVGDSLTVLDRFDPRIRGGLVASQAAFASAGFAVAVACALALGLTDAGGALLFGVMVSLWLVEEVGRRLLMARLEFWKLVLNDAVYVGSTLLALAVLWAGGHLTLNTFVLAMAVGATAAVLVAGLQLPRQELSLVRPSWAALREVGNFAVWRSAQAGIRPLSLLTMRITVVAVASRAALGQLEAARLLVAPVLAFTGGAGAFLLPMYSDDERWARRRHSVPVRHAAMLLVAATVAYGMVTVAFSGPMARLLTAGTITIDELAVVGWVLFAAAFAAGLPLAHAAVARRQSRQVFLIRALDSLVGLGLVIPLVVYGSPSAAPWGIAAGMVVGTLLLVRLYRKSMSLA